MIGLVMTGGSARGAYQAGVLKRIGEIKRVHTEGNPFPIIGGSSAGAINGCAAAAGSDDFSSATGRLALLWAGLTPSVDLSQLAEQHQRDMPYLIQYFVKSLGRDAGSCSDLMSYLLFTSQYTSALIEIGYNDACKRIDEIETFLYTDEGSNGDNPRGDARVTDRAPRKRA